MKFKNLKVKDFPTALRMKRLQGVTFQRSGVAYGETGNRVTVTNLLTANQSNCTNSLGNTTGFTAINSANISSSTERAYTGTRSVKVVTPGVTEEGVDIRTSITTLAPFTLSIWVYAPLGATFTAQFTNITTVTNVPFTGTGTWQKVTGTVTPTVNSGIYIRIKTITTAQAITFYVGQAQLEYGLVAHDWTLGGTSYNIDTNVIPENTPRYKADGGVLVEEATTNLLTANQSTGGDTYGDTTGFTKPNGAETLSYSTAQAYQGNGSIKVDTTDSGANQGVQPTTMSASPSTAYTGSIRLKGSGIVKLLIVELNSSNGYIGETKVDNITLTDTWTYYSVSRTLSASGAKIAFQVLTTTAQAITFYVDMLQIEAKAYPTSWTLGGTTRNAETLTIPSSVLNIDTNGYSNLLTANVSTCSNTLGDTTGFTSNTGAEISSSTEEAYQGNRSIKVITPGVSPAEGVILATVTTVSGVVYSGGVWVKAPLGAGLRLYSSNPTKNVEFTGTGDWQFVETNFTSNQINTNMKVITNATTQAVTFYVGQAIFSATSSAKPWILGGTQSNNGAITFEMEVYATTNFITSSGTKKMLLSTKSGSLTNAIYINMDSGSSGLILEMKDNVGSSLSNSASLTGYSGWVKIAIALDNNSARIYVNGVYKSQIPSPKLPSGRNNVYIGSYETPAQFVDTHIRNVVISKRKRSDSEIAQRALSGFIVDKDVTFIAPMTKDLKAYRVGKVS